MKRSQVVVQMCRYYNLKQYDLEQGSLPKEEFFAGILELAEELGMYPPDRFNKEGDCYVSEWDPE